MAKFTNTVLAVNPAGQTVTKVSFDNNVTVSWFDNGYGGYDVLITNGIGIHQTQKHYTDSSVVSLNLILAQQKVS